MICAEDKSCFSTLAVSFDKPVAVGIGTYKEKDCTKSSGIHLRGHAADRGKIGRYVADILLEGEIYEIQTGSLYPLRESLNITLTRLRIR